MTCPHHYTDANHFGRFLRTLKGILERDRLIDQMGSVHSYGPPGTSFSPLELIDLDSHPGSWETFPGTWGEKQYFWVENAAGKLPSVPFGNSPSATFIATTFDGFWHDTSD